MLTHTRRFRTVISGNGGLGVRPYFDPDGAYGCDRVVAAGRHLAANDASGQGEPTASVVAAITPDPGATLWNDDANGTKWSPF